MHSPCLQTRHTTLKPRGASASSWIYPYLKSLNIFFVEYLKVK